MKLLSPDPRFSSPINVIVSRYALLSQDMMNQFWIEIQKEPGKLQHGRAFYRWVRTPGIPHGERECQLCQRRITGDGSQWIQHENECVQLQSLAIRTMKNLIRIHDPRVADFMIQYPIETNAAANELLEEVS